MSRRLDLPLLLGALALVGAFCAIARLGVVWDRAHAFVGLYLLACAGWGAATVAVLGQHARDTRPRLALVLAAGLAARLLVLPHPIADDGARYLWEARVVLAGLDPYLLPPADPRLSELAARAPEFARVNHPAWTAIYPPPMLLLQAAVCAIEASGAALKAAFVLAEAALVAALLVMLRQRGLPAVRVLVYAWCPLPIVATALEGHHDAVASAALMGALACVGPARPSRVPPHARGPRGLRALSGALLAMLAVGFKGLPLAALPALWSRLRTWRLALAALALAPTLLPFRDAGAALLASLHRFGAHMHTNDSVHALVALLVPPGPASRLVCAAIGLGVAVWVVRRGPADPAARAAILLATLYLLLPTAHPWYLMMLVPLLALFPWPGWLALCASVSATWWLWPRMRADGAWVRWVESPRAKLIEYAPLALWLLAVTCRRLAARRPPTATAGPRCS